MISKAVYSIFHNGGPIYHCVKREVSNFEFNFVLRVVLFPVKNNAKLKSAINLESTILDPLGKGGP